MGGMGCCAVVIVSRFTELLRPRKGCSWVLLSGLMGGVTLLMREGELLGDSQLGIYYGGVIWGSTNPACVKSLGSKEWKTPSFEVPQLFFLPTFKGFFFPPRPQYLFTSAASPLSDREHRSCGNGRDTRKTSSSRSRGRHRICPSLWMLPGTVPDGCYFTLISLLVSSEAVRQEVFP